ncbi:MAG TPA: histidine--tRNA ligase [Chthoniobacterales bacterium]
MQTLPGFRELYPEDCARRNYLFHAWRAVARRYGFQEYDGPTLEAAELYEKKNSGGEILQQLYQFEDRGGRRVALRPEMTPTLARMAADREKQSRKPMKWFSIGPFFRHERQQKGRLREFIQLNCDLLGDSSPGADAETLALCIDLLRELGFDSNDIVLRLSDRRAWTEFLKERSIAEERAGDFLAIVDKLEREPEESLREKLAEFGITLDDVRAFIASEGNGAFAALLADLEARGLRDYARVDLSIVRGLAYYTGLVFEVFDRAKKFRAVAGGGRYDQLVASLSEGRSQLPAIGFGMGDVVLMNLIEATPHALARLQAGTEAAVQIYGIVADEAQRGPALGLVQRLREAGWRVDFGLTPAKVGKQFQAAEASGATFAVLVGGEWPEVKVKHLPSRTEQLLPQETLADWLKTAQL